MRYRLLIFGFVLFFLGGLVMADDQDVRHKPGQGFIVQSADGEFSLNIGGRIQLRHTYERYDRFNEGRGIEATSLSNFAVQRMRIWLKGQFFREWRYKFQADFGHGNARLKDGQIEWRSSHKVHLSFGQFKVFFDRQQKISSGKQTFVDRSIAAREFGISRDIGFQFYGASKSKIFQYSIGLFNGEGEGGENPNDGHLFVGHLSWNPNGDFGLSESDLMKTDEHLWFIDLGAAYNGKRLIDAIETDDFRYVAGFGYRHAGIYWQNEYYRRTLNPEGFPEIESDGWYSQMGFMLQPRTWEIAVRYSLVDPDKERETDTIIEKMLGVNRFFRKLGHAFKVTWDMAQLIEKAESPGADGSGPKEELKDLRYRLQLQIIY